MMQPIEDNGSPRAPSSSPVAPPSITFDDVQDYLRGFSRMAARHIVLVAGLCAILGLGSVFLFDGLMELLFTYAINDSAGEVQQPQYWLFWSKFGFLLATFFVIYEAGTAVLAVGFASRLVEPAVPMSVAIGWAVKRFPLVVFYSLTAAVAVLAGCLAFVLPGVYLAFRLFPVGCVALFEPDENPISRSWEITRNRGSDTCLATCGVWVMLILALFGVGAANYLAPVFPGKDWILNWVQFCLQFGLPTLGLLLLYGWYQAEAPPVEPTKPDGLQ